MTLRAKLLLAQAAAGRWRCSSSASVGSASTATRSAAARRTILKDNYRSVLAAQRMKERARAHRQRARCSCVAGARERGARADRRATSQRFERELRGRRRATSPSRASARRPRGCAQRWDRLPRARSTRFARRRRRAARAELYFDELQPALRRGASDAPTAILALNQDAMVRKSDARAARGRAARTRCCSRPPRSAACVGAAAPRRCSPARLLRPLSVLAPGGAPARRGRPRGARAGRRAATRSRSSRASSTPWPSGCSSTARARSASCSQAQQRVAGGDRQPARSGAGARRSTASCCNANRPPRRCSSVDAESRRERARRARPGGARDASSACAQHVPAARARYVPKGLEEAVRVATRRRRARCFLPRATPVYAEEGDVVGADRRAAGRDPPAPLRRAARTTWSPPSRTSSARRSPRCAWRSTLPRAGASGRSPRSRPTCCTPRARTASGCRRSSTSCSTCRASRPGASSCALRRVDAEALVARGARRAARRGASAQRRARDRGAARACRRCAVDRGAHRSWCFANLLGNAIRHSPRGGRGARARAPRRRRACASRCVDTGPGIPREYRQAIFEKFFRVPGAPPGGAGPRPLHRARDRAGARRRDRRRERARAAAARSGSRCRARRRSVDCVTRSACACATASRRRCRGSRAASSSVGVRASTRWMCSRSICVEREVAAEPRRARARCARDALGQRLGLEHAAPATGSTARSMALRSSRTLPGHA